MVVYMPPILLIISTIITTMSSKEDFYLKVGQRIDELRQEKGLSFQELANKASIEKSNLVKITKEGKNITLGTLWSISKGLGVEPGELVR